MEQKQKKGFKLAFNLYNPLQYFSIATAADIQSSFCVAGKWLKKRLTSSYDSFMEGFTVEKTSQTWTTRV